MGESDIKNIHATKFVSLLQAHCILRVFSPYLWNLNINDYGSMAFLKGSFLHKQIQHLYIHHCISRNLFWYKSKTVKMYNFIPSCLICYFSSRIDLFFKYYIFQVKSYNFPVEKYSFPVKNYRFWYNNMNLCKRSS